MDCIKDLKKNENDDIINAIISLEKGLNSSATIPPVLTARLNRSS